MSDYESWWPGTLKGCRVGSTVSPISDGSKLRLFDISEAAGTDESSDMELAEALVTQGVRWLGLAIEAAGAIVIAIGCLVTTVTFVRRRPGKTPGGFTLLRLGLTRYLALGPGVPARR